MRMTLFGLATLVAALAGDVRPSEARAWYPWGAARAWYPWCAQFADRSGSTQCLFASFEQCLATVRGIGGSCVQNWYPPPGAPPRERRWKHFHR